METDKKKSVDRGPETVDRGPLTVDRGPLTARALISLDVLVDVLMRAALLPRSCAEINGHLALIRTALSDDGQNFVDPAGNKEGPDNPPAKAVTAFGAPGYKPSLKPIGGTHG